MPVVDKWDAVVRSPDNRTAHHRIDGYGGTARTGYRQGQNKIDTNENFGIYFANNFTEFETAG